MTSGSKLPDSNKILTRRDIGVETA